MIMNCMNQAEIGPVSELLSYLKTYNPSVDQPWILAVSAGVDSMVLLSAFMKIILNKSAPLPPQIIVAHVNHGWREEAHKDAELINSFLESFSQPNRFLFRLEKLDASLFEKGENSEAIARRARYDYFEKIAKEEGAFWLFLAHHLGDKQETLFKNLFEGKELVYLDGPKPHLLRNELHIARPFLTLEKKDLIAFSDENKVPFEFDVTNKDFKFLRVRMRQKLEPVLDDIYPTMWREGLKQVSSYLVELQDVLDSIIEPHSLTPIKGILGLRWKAPEVFNQMQKMALRYWLRQISARVDPLQRQGSHRLVNALLEGSRGYEYRSRLYLWSVYAPYVFALEPDFEKRSLLFLENEIVQKGSSFDRWGSWRIFQQEFDRKLSAFSTWDHFWQGRWSSPIMLGGYWVKLSDLPTKLRKSRLHRYQNLHVPRFLRTLAPVWISDKTDEAACWSLGDRWPENSLGSRLWQWDELISR